MTNDTDTVGEYWSKFFKAYTGENTGQFWWDAGPDIYAHRNVKTSGDPSVGWIQYTLEKYFDEKLPLSNCLSLGCGEGELERHLAAYQAFHHCDAYDVAEEAIQQARMIINIEDTFLECSEFESDFSYIVARPTKANLIA